MQSRRHGEWAHGDHTGLKLTVETSIFVLLAGGWLWGVLALGAHATATQGPTSHGGGLSGRGVLSCPAPPHGVPAGHIAWLLAGCTALVAVFAPITMYLYRNKE